MILRNNMKILDYDFISKNNICRKISLNIIKFEKENRREINEVDGAEEKL